MAKDEEKVQGMAESDKVRLPGLETLFGLRKEDPLSYLAASDLHRSRSNTSALRSSLDSTPTPSLASSSRSDPFAFSLNSQDNASIRSWGATSSSEYDDARSTLSRQSDHDVKPTSWASTSPPPVARRRHRAARISRNLDTLSAMRGYSELLPPSAPPRSSSLQSVNTISSMLDDGDDDARMEEVQYQRPDLGIQALEQSLFFRTASNAPMPDSPATERGTLPAFDGGSDTASIRSTRSYGARSDLSSPHHYYAPLPAGRASQSSMQSSMTSESSPRSSTSTAPTSYENMPPSAFGTRGRRSLEMAAEMLPGQFEQRHIEHPLSHVLPPVNEAPIRMSPEMMPSPLPPAPMQLAPPLSASVSSSGSLSASGSLRYPCPHCYKRFSRPSSLRIHVFSHTGEKPYVCKVCGRGFSVQSNLRRHGRIHAGTGGMTPATPEVETVELEESEGDDASGEGDVTMVPA